MKKIKIKVVNDEGVHWAEEIWSVEGTEQEVKRLFDKINERMYDGKLTLLGFTIL